MKANHLVEILNTIFTDVDRPFNTYQRERIWASRAEKVCEVEGCGREVTWDTFHAGHIEPRALGGKSVISNGRIECVNCNLSAGARVH